ncbi:MAG TPA: hypothetical protein VIG30_01830 [Ktedonobacterales bacterium]
MQSTTSAAATQATGAAPTTRYLILAILCLAAVAVIALAALALLPGHLGVAHLFSSGLLSHLISRALPSGCLPLIISC